MAGVLIEINTDDYDDDHLIVIDAPLKENTQIITIDFVVQPPSLGQFNSTLLQQHIQFKQEVSAEVKLQQQVLEMSVVDHDVILIDKQPPSVQLTIPIEQIDNVAEMLANPTLIKADSLKANFAISGLETPPEKIIEAYRTLITVLNAFNSSDQIKFRQQQTDKFTALQAALRHAKTTNNLVLYAQAYQNLKLYIESADYITLNASMECMTQCQEIYMSVMTRGPKFHRENSRNALDKVAADVLERQNTAMRKGLSGDDEKTSEEKKRLEDLKKVEERYSQAYVLIIKAMQVGDFILDEKNSNCLLDFSLKISRAVTKKYYESKKFKPDNIEAVMNARVLLDDIERCSKDASDYIKDRLVVPIKYLNDLKASKQEELIIFQKQQLEIAKVRVIAYRKNNHAAQVTEFEQVQINFETIVTDDLLSADLLMDKLKKLHIIKINLQTSIENTKQAAELSASTDSSQAPEERTRLQRWTQHAKANPVKSALLAVSACVLFKLLLVAAGVVGVMEALKPAGNAESSPSPRL